MSRYIPPALRNGKNGKNGLVADSVLAHSYQERPFSYSLLGCNRTCRYNFSNRCACGKVWY
jgi:hypothetical protein